MKEANFPVFLAIKIIQKMLPNFGCTFLLSIIRHWPYYNRICYDGKGVHHTPLNLNKLAL